MGPPRLVRDGVGDGTLNRELARAGITDPRLRASYLRCRELNASYGKTYYLATLLLPPATRPHVHALYGFARYADEIVDDLASTKTDAEKAAWLDSWGQSFLADVARGHSDDAVCAAVVDTVLRYDIPIAYFEAFLHSMQMDLTVTGYPTYDALYEYVYGSAAVIGLQMLAVLGSSDSTRATQAAIDLGVSFQLANFIRDVGEDLVRGRVYLPADELAEHGVSRADLERRVVTPALRAALGAQIRRVRDLEARSRLGITLLPVTARPCIDAARVLYCGIVDEVERTDYQVFDVRATVPMRRRLAVAAPAWVQAVAARRHRNG